jgi:hypothetical protein
MFLRMKERGEGRNLLPNASLKAHISRGSMATKTSLHPFIKSLQEGAVGLSQRVKKMEGKAIRSSFVTCTILTFISQSFSCP